MKARLAYCLLAGVCALALACTPAEPPPEEEAAAVVDPCEGLNTLNSAEKAEGWQLLFDGKTMDGWHGYNGQSTEAWMIEDCALKSVGTEGNYGSDTRADIATDGEFTNYELTIDWKATKAGNSGLMYGVIEDPKYDTAWKTGPEYQFVDDTAQFDFGDGNLKDLPELNQAGADYEMHAAAEDKELKPVGEWNTTKIVVSGPHVEHWLNGSRIVEFERWTDEWNDLKNAGKWADYPDWGMAKTGRIVIQDHGSVFWFRNIKIREIRESADEE